MKFEKIKETKDVTIFKKRSGRYCVQSNNGKWINGEDKIKILLAEKLIVTSVPKKKEEPKAEPPKTEQISEEQKTEEVKKEEKA